MPGARHLERHAAPGLDELRAASCCAASRSRRRAPAAALAAEEELAEHRVFRPAADRGCARRARRGRAPSASAARAVERLIARHDLENEEALAHVEHRLRRMGVIRALEAAGFEPGDDVEIGGVVFELDPG